MKRLIIQDQMITAAMGGTLPEQPDTTRFHDILDVGCGPGNWLLMLAQTNSSLSLAGADVSRTIIEYARSQAEAQQVQDYVKFYVMDALRMLSFPPASFDLVNLRFGSSFLRTWDWPKMLAEMQRVLRSGGTLRVTEPLVLHESESPAYMEHAQFYLRAFAQAGFLFEENVTGLTDHLPRLLKQSGCQNIQTKEHVMHFHGGTPQGRAYAEDMKHALRTVRPFLQKWVTLPDNYDTLLQKAIAEMERDDFHTTWRLRTVWGTKP